MQIFNLQQPKSKILQVVSFKIKGFYKFFKYIFCLQVIKLINKRVEVKREVKGQRERTFTKIITNSLLGLMQRIKSERKLQLLLPPQTITTPRLAYK
jgi:hypothetical protein